MPQGAAHVGQGNRSDLIVELRQYCGDQHTEEANQQSDIHGHVHCHRPALLLRRSRIRPAVAAMSSIRHSQVEAGRRTP
jgi:hypothetical protein